MLWKKHDRKVSIRGRNLRFVDDIDALAEEEQELEALVESLDKIWVYEGDQCREDQINNKQRE